MKFSALFCALLSIASVSAKVFNINVGENEQLQFNPPCIWGAVAGDQVVFKFLTKNHTVTQSTFSTPCHKESETSFDSGFMPANASSEPTVTFTLDAQSASAPQWFYCRQKNPVSHCNKGMLFAINPTPTKTFAQYQQNAINDVSNSTTGGAPCTTTSAPSTTATASSSESSGYDNGSSTGYNNGSSTGNNGSSTGYDGSSTGYNNGSSDESSSGNSGSSSASSGTVHSILVGENNTLTFNPPSIQAVAGDTIEFTFLSKNHSATQSTFTNPCSLAPGGVDSGFQPVSANSSTTMQWSITLDAKSASSPLWFFCAQTQPAVHCRAGMVFAINANADKTFDQYQTNAKNSANSTSGSSNSPASNSAASPTPAPTSAAASNVNTASNGVPGLRSSLSTVVLTVIVGSVTYLSL